MCESVVPIVINTSTSFFYVTSDAKLPCELVESFLALVLKNVLVKQVGAKLFIFQMPYTKFGNLSDIDHHLDLRPITIYSSKY